MMGIYWHWIPGEGCKNPEALILSPHDRRCELYDNRTKQKSDFSTLLKSLAILNLGAEGRIQ